jgi:general secretion pathway protein J
MAMRRTDRGFTLLELLIALAVLGLIIALLTSGTRYASRAWQTQETQVDRENDLLALQTVLRAMIASGSAFQGSSGSLAFTGTMPRGLQQSGLFDMQLTTSGDRLVLAWAPHLRPGATPKPTTETELARGVVGLDLSYFVADDAHPPGVWSAVTKDQKHPPSLVRLGILLPDGDHRSWPPLVIAPMLAGVKS